MPTLFCVLLIEISLYKKLNTRKKSANFVNHQENISKETEKYKKNPYVENYFNTRETYLELSQKSKRKRLA